MGRSAESRQRHAQATRAYRAAQLRLANRHRSEFEALYAEERAARGVPKGLRPSASRECSRCQLPIDTGTLCEFCFEWDA